MEDKEYTIDMNAWNGENPDGSFGDKIDFSTLDDVVESKDPITLVGTRKAPKQNNKLSDTLSKAIKNLSQPRSVASVDPSYLTKNRTGIAMMLDNMGSASGQPTNFAYNRAFTGITPEEQMQLISSEEYKQGMMLGDSANRRARQGEGLLSDQQLDAQTLRALTNTSLESLPQLAKLVASQNSEDATAYGRLLNTYKAMSQSKGGQDQDVMKRLEDALLRLQGL